MKDLTDREAQLLNLIASGVVNEDALATRLGISINTVKNHKTNMFRKMGLWGKGSSLRAVLKGAGESIIDMELPEAQPDLLAIADALQQIAWRLRAFAEETR